jgi:hypothetical protein
MTMRMKELLRSGQFRWELVDGDGSQLSKGPTWNSREEAERDPWRRATLRNMPRPGPVLRPVPQGSPA